MRTINKFVLALFIGFGFLACSKSGTDNSNASGGGTGTPVNIGLPATFAKGADVSWLTEMESTGYKFYNANGVQEDCFQVLKETGINSIRLRVWVNPANNWCNKADVLAKALRAKAAGMRIMIDFHYSDSWADPGKQTKPAAWVGENISALETSVYNHTTDVLSTLNSNGVVPTWVQVGNETDDGMLWEEGRASTNMANFAALVNSGYAAVKAVNANIKVIVHTSNGYNNTLFRYMYDGLKANNANYDIIGMSLYPSTSNWNTLNTECLANMNDMVNRYGKQVIICEVGMDVNSPGACNGFLTDLITKVNSVSGNNGLGVFYWEPESYGNWQNYTLGAFDSTGKPSYGLQAFLIQ